MTTEYKLRKLVNPTKEELDAAARIAAEAFHDDFNRACLGGNWDLLFPFWRGVVGAQQIGGENVVAVTDDGKFVGLAGWYPPGRMFLETPDQAEDGYSAFVSKLPAEQMEWFMQYFMPKYSEVTTQAFGEGTKKDVWNLQTLCVLPEYQRRGIGRSLVKDKEDQIIAEKSGQAITLESEVEKNVSSTFVVRLSTLLIFTMQTELYKKWGFEVKGKSHFESKHGDFDMWCLYKKLPSS
ncbi:hypothetical protein K474DRAFT_1094828 [Panus rudis PR-1116 ss-1]|nr:hypothetical protein K474DRAFT_1094828 [Panus rudis PR-1116 ss-1]